MEEFLTSQETIFFTTGDFFNVTNNSRNTEDVLPKMPSVFEASVMYILSIAAILSNIVVFYALPRLKGKMRAQTRYCMISLVITDSMLGFTVFITRTIYIRNVKLYMDYICNCESILCSFFVSMTIFGLTLMSIDRVLVILSPVKYSSWITELKFLIVIALAWFGFSIRYVVEFVYSSGEILEGAYICIQKYEGRNWHMAVGIFITLIVPFASCIASFIALAKLLRSRVKIGKNKAKSKESATVLSAIFLLTTVYFFMTAPFCICVLLWKALTGHPLNPTANFITTSLLVCNSVVNPYIYLATMKSYRREVLGCISKITGRKQRLQSTFDESRISTHDDITL